MTRQVKHLNKMTTMTKELFQKYKQTQNTVPRCPCCNTPILQKQKCMRLTNTYPKYLCHQHAKIYNKYGKIPYQYQLRNKKKTWTKPQWNCKPKVNQTPTNQTTTCTLKTTKQQPTTNQQPTKGENKQ